ncbi:transmembrane secretion effector [Motilibacter peucedani]|uniref:Transmembrane secretion effector n=1 Tax=Motilibacter peucedani TaxID=598650 RepID=A0A420XKP0_9ACTN|nr:MFS transporter [Motilibacter peucedani]RKS68007.1 transmembrane secretion effector [Motilibacter peucedani]
MAGPAGGRFGNALRSRDLRLLLAAFGVDAVGGWAYNVVLVIYVYERTGSAPMIAATTACGWVPRLLFSAYAGVLADRYERTRVMVASALACLATTAVLAAVVFTDGPVVLVLALHVLTASAATAYGPAARAIVPETVPEKDLASANALFTVLENLVVVVGPAIGGLLLLTGEPGWGVVVNAATFVVSALLARSLRVRSAGGAADEDGGLLAQVRTGLTALRNEPVALVLVLYCALDSGIYGALAVLYVPMSEQFGTGPKGYGYLLASMALGGVLAGGLVNRLASSSRLAPVIVGGMCVMALPVAASAPVTSPVVGALLQVVAGTGMVAVDVLAITALQRDLPRTVLSRVFGVLDTVVLAGILLASALASAVLALTSPKATLVIMGLGFAAVSVAAVRPLLRADRTAAAEHAALRPRVALLEVLDLLAAAPTGVLEQLARAVQEVELAAGAVVVREGEPADAFYVVTSGEVAVTAAGDELLRTLGDRSYFGEIGLLRGLPRTATVTTTEPTTLWRIAAADFSAALETSAPSASMLRVAGARLARSGPALAA